MVEAVKVVLSIVGAYVFFTALYSPPSIVKTNTGRSFPAKLSLVTNQASLHLIAIALSVRAGLSVAFNAVKTASLVTAGALIVPLSIESHASATPSALWVLLYTYLLAVI